MAWTRQITLTEYENVLQEMMQLQMWYVIYAVRQGKPFAEAICGLTEVYAYCRCCRPTTGPTENTEFMELLWRLEALWRSVGDVDFPAESWRLLKPQFTGRMEKDLAAAQKSITNSYAGFTYEYHCEYFGPPTPELVTLHFRNYFTPDSPFHHRRELIEGLLKIIELAAKDRSDVNRVQCASWLNNIEPFYSLFPEEWYKTSYACPVEGNLGWWGQFIDRTGRLHQDHVAKFKRTGEFLYANRHGRCSITDLREHLLRLQCNTTDK